MIKFFNCKMGNCLNCLKFKYKKEIIMSDDDDSACSQIDLLKLMEDETNKYLKDNESNNWTFEGLEPGTEHQIKQENKAEYEILDPNNLDVQNILDSDFDNENNLIDLNSVNENVENYTNMMLDINHSCGNKIPQDVIIFRNILYTNFMMIVIEDPFLYNLSFNPPEPIVFSTIPKKSKIECLKSFFIPKSLNVNGYYKKKPSKNDIKVIKDFANQFEKILNFESNIKINNKPYFETVKTFKPIFH